MSDEYKMNSGEVQAAVTLWNMTDTVNHINRDNGWFDTDRTFGDDCALLHSEVSELFEAYRKDMGKDEMGKELADILIRLLDTAYRQDISIGYYFALKCEENRQRGYRHGGRKV